MIFFRSKLSKGVKYFKPSAYRKTKDLLIYYEKLETINDQQSSMDSY